jgi:SAM-dependent methyltransferase
VREIGGIDLKDIQAEYGRPDGELSELIMGEQVHIGGMQSSMELAQRADIGAGMVGVDLCCATGAGMRFLVRFRDVTRMTGVDATGRMVELGRERCRAEGLSDQITFVMADACASGLPNRGADFVWGEDAWCYVVDKARLIAEATRIVRRGGTIAFTDWVEGPVPLSRREAERFLRFMKFPSILDLDDYQQLLKDSGCRVEVAEDTGRFRRYLDLYRDMVTMQLTYDALRLVGFNTELMRQFEDERNFIRELAHQHKVIQGLFVAERN